MKFVFYIIGSFFIFGCVKTQSKDPVPVIEYKNFVPIITNTTESAILSVTYEDGDGDIFRDNTSDGPNFICTIFAFDTLSKQFLPIINPITPFDTLHFTQAITQVGDGYKGKQVKGEISWPMSQFRPSSAIKIFYYKIFMVDMKNNKSNVITTPTFTL